MKFAEHLSAHLTPEWRKQYIEYEVTIFNLFISFSHLKRSFTKLLMTLMIYQVFCVLCYFNPSVVDAVTVSRHFDECDAVFFAMCQAELEKINNFFAGLCDFLDICIWF